MTTFLLTVRPGPHPLPVPKVPTWDQSTASGAGGHRQQDDRVGVGMQVVP